MHTIAVRIPDEYWAQLQARADDTDRTPSAEVRRAIRLYLSIVPARAESEQRPG